MSAPDELQAEMQRLARRLGGGWRIEHGVMPVVVLTQSEAQALKVELDQARADERRVIAEALREDAGHTYAQYRDLLNDAADAIESARHHETAHETAHGDADE